MAERRKNKSFWRQMRAMHMRPVREYAKKYGLTFEQAELDLQAKAIFEQDDREFLEREGLRRSKHTDLSVHEEE